jgi:hypothetical protein
MSVGRFLQQAAAGNAGGGVYVEDVFSTYLYVGNGSTQTITNGIDLDGEGGLVWIKGRDAARPPLVYDTERGVQIEMQVNSGSAEATDPDTVTAFNSDGFDLDADGSVNVNNENFVSWTFRKQPGFFDVVTYTGDGTNDQAISHNLGSVPGMILVKRRDVSESWYVYHRSVGTGKLFRLTSTNPPSTSSDKFDVEPTSTQFFVGYDSGLNNDGSPFVAYLFAHDDQQFGEDSDEAIIKCDKYTGNGSSTGPDVNVGFEPQWLLIKKIGSGTNGNWLFYDSMRGIVSGGTDQHFAMTANLEANDDRLELTPTGFKLTTTSYEVNSSGADYVYLAIRRPHKPASEFGADELFETVAGSGNPAPNFISGFPVDMYFNRKPATSPDNWDWSSRLTQGRILQSNLTNAESTNADFSFDYQNGVMSGGYTSTLQSWMFRRAPGFFDVVTYTGDGTSSHAISHSLGVTPELMIVKRRSASAGWYVWESSFAGTSDFVFLNSSNAKTSASTIFPSDPTSSNFTVGSSVGINNSGDGFIAFLFATVSGISKVGSYSGTGSNLTIDCGFSSGARFVLIKSTTFAGGWHLWDSVRGITTGNDYYIKLNGSGAQTTDGVVDIEPDSSGFILNGPNANINSSGEEYIFLAIA